MPIKRSFSNIYSEMDKINVNRKKENTEKKNYEIEGLFKPKMVNGKFSIVLRFLPSHPNEELPWIENRNHLFQLDNGSWFGCDCAKKFNKPCPICDYNAKVWEKYGRTDEARAKVKAKWRPNYYSNILIIKNDNQPDTVGKVYRLQYGRAIMKKIQEAMENKDDPELGIIPGINPFSWWGPNDEAVIKGDEKAGANFVWEAVQGSNGPNYDSSHFNPARRISKFGPDGKLHNLTDDEIDAIESQLYTLKDIEIKEDAIRSYGEVLEFYKKKSGEDLMAEFTDGSSDYAATTKSHIQTEEADDEEMFSGTPLETKKQTVTETVKKADFTNSMPFDEESESQDNAETGMVDATEEDDDDFFARLANG